MKTTWQRCWAEHAGGTVWLPWTEDGRPICPVCALLWPENAEAAWSGNTVRGPDGSLLVGPSWGSCPRCGIEFGLDDFPAEGETLSASWRDLRLAWLSAAPDRPDFAREVAERFGDGPPSAD